MQNTELISLIFGEIAGQGRDLVISKTILRLFNDDLPVTILCTQLIAYTKTIGYGFHINYDGWQNTIHLTKQQVHRAGKILVELNLLKTKRHTIKGIPKVHYYFSMENFSSYFLSSLAGAKASPKSEIIVHENSIHTEKVPAYDLELYGQPHKNGENIDTDSVIAVSNTDKGGANPHGYPLSYNTIMQVNPVIPTDLALVNTVKSRENVNFLKSPIKYIYIIMYITYTLNIDILSETGKNQENFFSGFSYLDFNLTSIRKVKKKINEIFKDPDFRKYKKEFEAVNGKILKSEIKKCLDEIINESLPIELTENKKTRNTIDKQCEDIIEYWNKLKNVRSHKNTQTDIYKKSKKRIKQLLSGKLSTLPICRDFLKKNNIPENILSVKWTMQDVIDQLTEVSKLFDESYFPEKKDWLPKDLSTLIFNPRKKNSWYLITYANPVQTLEVHQNLSWKNTMTEEIRDALKEFTEFVSKAQGTDLADQDETKLYHVMNGILNEYDNFCDIVPDHRQQYLKEHIEDKFDMLSEYGKYIVAEYEKNPKFTVHWVGKNMTSWSHFIKKFYKGIGMSDLV